MRIAQLANFVGPSSGGIRTAVKALGRGYVAAGAERLLVVPGPCDTRSSTEAGEIVQIRAPRVGGGYRLIVDPWRVIDTLEAFGPTSVEVSDKSTLLPVAAWARRTGVPSVLFSHERLDAMLELRTGLGVGVATPVQALNRSLVRRFDAVVVTSHFAAAEFGRVAAQAATPLFRVPLGVDLDVFRPVERAPHEGPLRLVHLGRLSREKSPHLAVETALALHARGRRVHLDVYGDGPQRDRLEELAAGAPVTFHGHVGDRRSLGALVAEADVALSVCPGETFGLAVLEALASGTPVVTADTGGARELVDRHCGAWASAHPEALADAVLDVARRPLAVRREAARRRAEQFGWERTVEAMLALHGGLGSRPGPGRLAATAR